MNDTALVTIAVGEPYLSNWRKYCAPSWRTYAAKHGIDLVCIDQPLDRSALAQSRSLGWQKCLVLSQPWAAKYRQVVLLDSDVVINAETAPKITADVPVERVGGVISGSHLPEDLRVIVLHALRGLTYPCIRGAAHWQQDQQTFYEFFSLPPQPEGVIQTGVLVMSPAHHRELMMHVYQTPYGAEDRGYEQVPLSYEILSRKIFEPLDTRFNSVFFETMLIYYPHLADPDFREFEFLAKYATRIQLFNNFFLHFAYNSDFMRFLTDETPAGGVEIQPTQPAKR